MILTAVAWTLALPRRRHRLPRRRVPAAPALVVAAPSAEVASPAVEEEGRQRRLVMARPEREAQQWGLNLAGVKYLDLGTAHQPAVESLTPVRHARRVIALLAPRGASR
jgi:hypothetical protein